MTEYRFKYEYARRFGNAEHTWSAVGAKGAIHLNIREYKPDEYSGGIEIHHRYPPDYMSKQAPSHDQCWILKAPCWHDGSSLEASEIWIPHWQEFQGAPDEHDRMFKLLGQEMDERFETADAAPTVPEMLNAIQEARCD